MRGRDHEAHRDPPAAAAFRGVEAAAQRGEHAHAQEGGLQSSARAGTAVPYLSNTPAGGEEAKAGPSSGYDDRSCASTEAGSFAEAIICWAGFRGGMGVVVLATTGRDESVRICWS